MRLSTSCRRFGFSPMGFLDRTSGLRCKTPFLGSAESDDEGGRKKKKPTWPGRKVGEESQSIIPNHSAGEASGRSSKKVDGRVL